ncbi:MAG: S-layer homology domain-containing protein, partial [Clostridia bacterium]|nr:S-layer homology domain-containing protein [Clostridia bacterium]
NANGIVTGITENEFAPDNNITREQMATILYRYAKKENKSGEITYTDKDAISDYALDATAWANAAGIMKGNEDGSFAPLRNASRAEAAAVFVRLLNL